MLSKGTVGAEETSYKHYYVFSEIPAVLYSETTDKLNKGIKTRHHIIKIVSVMYYLFLYEEFPD